MSQEKIVCAFCGAEQKEIIFVIGASNQPDWCMIEGTGKITCPNCYPIAQAEGQAAIDRACRPTKKETYIITDQPTTCPKCGGRTEPCGKGEDLSTGKDYTLPSTEKCIDCKYVFELVEK